PTTQRIASGSLACSSWPTATPPGSCLPSPGCRCLIHGRSSAQLVDQRPFTDGRQGRESLEVGHAQRRGQVRSLPAVRARVLANYLPSSKYIRESMDSLNTPAPLHEPAVRTTAPFQNRPSPARAMMLWE